MARQAHHKFSKLPGFGFHFELAAVPGHLQPRIDVVHAGQSLGASRDIAALQRELADLEPMLVKAGVPSDSPPFKCLKTLRAAVDASVANDLPIIIW